MHRGWLRRLLLPLALGVLVACGGDDDDVVVGGDDDDDSVQPPPEADCDSVCDARLAAGCPGDTPAACLAKCEWDLSRGICESEINAYLVCLQSVPASSFGCDAGQRAVLPLEYCLPERDAMDHCIEGEDFYCPCPPDSGSSCPEEGYPRLTQEIVCDGREDCVDGEDEADCWSEHPTGAAGAGGAGGSDAGGAPSQGEGGNSAGSRGR
jgi:hypothetical protein